MKILNYKNDKMTNPSQPSLTKGRRVAFTKPSIGTSEARDEQKSTGTLSSRCDCERCRLMRGAVARKSRKVAFTLAEGATHVATCNGKRKIAFTLAEVLITLGIIGVVAAMTLPTLIQNHQKRSLEVATQKFYSTMSQAVKKYMADEGVDDLRNTPLASDNYEEWYSPEAIASIRNFVTKYLKVVKECNPSAEDDNNCFAPVYKYWDGSAPDYNFTTYVYTSANRDYVLADGAVIRIKYSEDTVSPGPIELYVDVNGKKGPNRVGYDLWNMSIFYDGVIEESLVGPECRGRIDSKYDDDFYKCIEYTAHEKRETKFEGTCQGNYGGCFGHFLNNNFKFDY